MKKSVLALPIILGIIVLISVPSVTAQSESNIIPSWIKGVANFWIEGGIDDGEFIEALEFMIDNNVIKLGENVVVDNTMSEIEAEFEAKLEEQSAKLRQERQNDSQEWGTLSNEYDKKLVDERKRYDDMVEEKGNERRQQVQELEDKIRELEIINGELESRNRYLENQNK